MHRGAPLKTDRWLEGPEVVAKIVKLGKVEIIYREAGKPIGVNSRDRP